jgi:hypothetical protein
MLGSELASSMSKNNNSHLAPYYAGSSGSLTGPYGERVSVTSYVPRACVDALSRHSRR